MGTSFLGRVFGTASRTPPAGESTGHSIESRHADLGSLSLIEVSDASALAGPLFRQAFNAEIPRSPRHFVLLRRAADRGPSVVGYVHYTKTERAYLAGGLVVAAMEFRRLDADTADLVRKEGGLAEWTMRTTCGWLDEADAVFAYMGDAKSIRVNLRVGFVPTEHQYLHVLWKASLESELKRALVERIAAIGPF